MKFCPQCDHKLANEGDTSCTECGWSLECLNRYDGKCKGPVQWRASLTGTGTPMARCDFHQDERLKLQERIQRDYPDSSTPPDWFDPTYAGEQWDIDS